MKFALKIKAMLHAFNFKLVSIFTALHLMVALLLGTFFGFAPDEYNYLYTFENLYGASLDPYPERNSGWITAPKPFLELVYFPAHIFNLIGIPSHLALRLHTIMLISIGLLLLLGESRDKNLKTKSILLFFLIPSVFFWTTIGMREAFILLEMILLLVGIRKFCDNKDVYSIFLKHLFQQNGQLRLQNKLGR